MKKSLIIPLVSLGVVALSIASILLASQKQSFAQLKAGDGKIELKMDYSDIDDENIDQYDYPGYHFCEFLISTKTMTGYDYVVDFQLGGDTKASGKVNSNILEIDDSGNEGYFNATFDFSNNTTSQKVTLSGEFDYAYGEPTTSETVIAEDGSAVFNVVNLKSCYVSSITISYYCI